MASEEPSDTTTSGPESTEQYITLSQLIQSGDTTWVDVQERLSNIQLRRHTAYGILGIYTFSLLSMIIIGILEGASVLSLGESFKWLIGIVAGQVSLLGLVIRGLFTVS